MYIYTHTLHILCQLLNRTWCFQIHLERDETPKILCTPLNVWTHSETITIPIFIKHDLMSKTNFLGPTPLLSPCFILTTSNQTQFLSNPIFQWNPNSLDFSFNPTFPHFLTDSNVFPTVPQGLRNSPRAAPGLSSSQARKRPVFRQKQATNASYEAPMNIWKRLGDQPKSINE